MTRNKRDKRSHHTKHLIHGFHNILEALYLEILISGTLVTSLKKIYDLVCDRLGIQTLIRLNYDLIKFSAASGKVVHGRIRHIYGHRHSIVSIADKGSVLFLCGDSADAECLGQI